MCVNPCSNRWGVRGDSGETTYKFFNLSTYPRLPIQDADSHLIFFFLPLLHSSSFNKVLGAQQLSVSITNKLGGVWRDRLFKYVSQNPILISGVNPSLFASMTTDCTSYLGPPCRRAICSVVYLTMWGSLFSYCCHCTWRTPPSRTFSSHTRCIFFAPTNHSCNLVSLQSFHPLLNSALVYIFSPVASASIIFFFYQIIIYKAFDDYFTEQVLWLFSAGH